MAPQAPLDGRAGNYLTRRPGVFANPVLFAARGRGGMGGVVGAISTPRYPERSVPCVAGAEGVRWSTKCGRESANSPAAWHRRS